MREKDLKEDLATLAYKAEADHEVQMARSDLYKIAKYSIKLHEMMKGVTEQEGIEGWVQSKITKAADYIGSVYHYLDYEMKFDEMTENKTPGDSHYNKEKAKKLAKADGKDPEKLSYGELQSYIAKAEKMKESKKAKPDYIDIDGDGDKKEPMKKAVKDKEAKKDKKESIDYKEQLAEQLGQVLSKKKTERSLTKGEEKKKEKYVKGMKKAKGDFKDRYGDDAEAVMYATATKMAKKESKDQETDESGIMYLSLIHI